MASNNGKKPKRSPKPNNKAPYPEEPINRKAEIPIVGLDASTGGQVDQQLLAVNEALEQRVAERTRALDEANKNLLQARDLFYALFHANPLPTALTRLEDALFIDVNEAYLTYFGLTRADVLNHFASELKLPIDPDLRPKLIVQLQREGSIHDLEMRILHPLNGTRIILVSLQLLKTDATNTIIQTFTDITDRVQAEQQIRLLASKLTEAEQDERRRISQVLHDDLQQRIFALKLQMSMLEEAYQKGDLESAQVDFTQLNEWLDESIAITRNLSIDLSPAILQGEGLSDALAWLAIQMQEQYELKVNLTTNRVNTSFEAPLRMLLFQAVREALFNIVKHAEILEAFITIEHVKGHIRLTVQDHGIGFDTEAISGDMSRLSGLLNIQERLNLMGCRLQIQSQPNQGTLVIIDIFSNR